MRRPTSLTLFAWYLIVASACSLVLLAMHAAKPEFVHVMQTKRLPVAMSIALGVLGDVVAITSAVGILNARRWGRGLCITLLAMEPVLWWCNNPHAPGIIVVIASLSLLTMLAIGGWALYRSPANAYFNGVARPYLAVAEQPDPLP